MLRKRIISNTAINFLGKGISYAIQLAIIAYIIGKIGKEGYGVVVLALGLIGNINLFESGFGLSVTKYIAEYNVKQNWEKINEIINTNFLVILIQDIIFFLLLFSLSHLLLNRLFNIPQHLQGIAVKVVDIFIFTGFINFFWTGLVRVAEGFQWYKLVREMEVVRDILRAVLLAWLLYIKPDIVNVGMAYLLSSIISLVVLGYLVTFREKRVVLGIGHIRWETFKQMFNFSLKIFIAKIYAFVSYRMDIFLIGFFLTTTSLTYYQIAYKFYELVKYLFSLISSTIVPVASELASLKSKEKLINLFEKATKYAIIITYIVIIVLYVTAERIIKVWVGTGFTESAALSQLFLVSLLPVAMVACGTEIMVGLDKLAPLLKYNGMAAGINLVVSLILIRRMGTAGVIWGTVIGSCIIAVTYLNYMLKYFQISTIKFLKAVFFKTALLTLVLYVVISLLPNLVVITAGIIGYTLISFVYLIDPTDKKLVYSYLHRA
jgi:O-antigen/teichoic acid export membrane protein